MPVMPRNATDITFHRTNKCHEKETSSSIHPATSVSDSTRTPQVSGDSRTCINNHFKEFIDFIFLSLEFTLFNDKFFSIRRVNLFKHLDKCFICFLFWCCFDVPITYHLFDISIISHQAIPVNPVFHKFMIN